MLYVVLDVHQSYIYAVAIDEASRKRSSGRLNPDWIAVQKYLSSLADRAKMVMEACYGWPSVYDALRGHAEGVVLSHPKKTKALYSARIKTDKIHASLLAQLLRADFAHGRHTRKRSTRPSRPIASPYLSGTGAPA